MYHTYNIKTNNIDRRVMEDILETIVSRRSIKKFKSDIPDKSMIEKIVKAGTYAPTGKNMQSPIILAVTNQDLRNKLSKLCAEVRGIDTDPFYNAPVALVVLADKSKFTYVYDGSCVIENMLLEAHSLELGACWIHHAKQMFETATGKEILNSLGIIGDYEGIGTCIVGVPNMEIKNKIPRKDNYVYWVE